MNTGKLWWIILVAFAAIAVLVFGAQYYISSMRQALWMQSVREILEVTSQSSHSYNVYFRKEADLLANIADSLAKTTPDSARFIQDFLPAPQRNTSYIIVDLKNGLAYMNKMEGGQKLTEAQQKFLDALGQKGSIGPYISSFTGQRFIGSYRRFHFADGSPGVLLYGQLVSTIASEFPVSFYDDSGFSYVVDKQGNILIRSQHQNSNWTFHNLFEVLERDGNAKSSIASFHDNLVAGRRGVASFRLGSEDYIFAFVPIDSQADWYLVSIVPDAVIMAYSSSAVRSSEMLSFLLALAALILAAFLLLFVLHKRKVREQDSEIRYREQLFNILANNTNDVFLMLDSSRCSIEYASPNMERALGIAPENARASLDHLMLPGFADEQVWPPTALALMEPGSSIKEEGEIENALTGAHGWFVKTVYKEIIENTLRYIFVLSDRTRERESNAALRDALERLREASAAKSAFLSNMSHDIRTPMNAIVGLATLLRRDAADLNKVLEYTAKIDASSQYLLGLINNVLDMSKIESGKMQLIVGEVSLARLMAELETVVRPQAREKQQQFQIVVNGLAHEKLLGDHLRLCQVLINLLSNAVKYTPRCGKIIMRVRQRVSSGTARMSFLVCDNGIGMSREYLARIFEAFTREHESITNTVQGTGLGMAITSQLTDLMGGRIRVRSVKGKGSAFLLTLDLKILPNDDREFWSKAGIRRILLFTENEKEATGVALMFANAGLECLPAKTASEALALLEKAMAAHNPVDIIIMECSLDQDVLPAFAKILSGFAPEQKPLLLLARGDANEHSELPAVADGSINMPLFMENLRAVVENLRASKAAATVSAKNGKSFKGKKALIVDDNEMNSDILGELLAMLDIESDVASNGRECLDILASAPPDAYDAVLMDVQMPVMNGHEATRAFRASGHARAVTMPIIAMTANTFDEDVRAAHEAGMNAHVAKPIDVDVLKRMLEEML